MQLYSYFRSTAAYRVRIALNMKQLSYEVIPVDLRAGKHLQPEYKQKNPQARIPTLVDGNFTLGQSLAILEYLDEKYPNPSIFPTDIQLRAYSRYLANIIIADLHPLNNLGVLNYLKNQLHQSEEQVMGWYHHWLKLGLNAFNQFLLEHKLSGRFCIGDEISLADLCLIPQIYNAQRFNFSMDAYPLLMKINDHCLGLDVFNNAQPSKQPDAV